MYEHRERTKRLADVVVHAKFMINFPHYTPFVTILNVMNVSYIKICVAYRANEIEVERNERNLKKVFLDYFKIV